MRNYRYNFFAGEDRTEAAFILYSASDDAACELASEVLAKSDWLFVEVWRGADMIFQPGSLR